MKKNKNTERKILKVDEKNSPFVLTESFRKLMTNIGFAIPGKEDGKGKVFCISSSVQAEGKSTVSVNLALTGARSGAKTVLVDCDLRKPTLHRYFNTSAKGLVEYLSGKAQMEEIVARDEETGLYVIQAGHTPPNPLVLFNDASFAALLEKLSSEYEYVLIDTPPLGLVADASIIGQKTDGVVLVARHMYSNHRDIKGVIGQLGFAKCNILGFVLNDFALSRDGYGGKYGRYGKYGKYGYYGGGWRTPKQ